MSGRLRRLASLRNGLVRLALAVVLGLAPALALGLAPGSALAAGTAVSAGAAQIVGGSACSVQPQASRSLCDGLLARSCGLVDSSDSYWLCRAFTDANCGLTANNDMYWLCRAVVTDGCGVAPPDYWILCQGIVQRTCANLDQLGYSWCVALASALPPPEAPAAPLGELEWPPST